MAQIWVPIDALSQGTLPSVCLVTGAREGVSMRTFDLPFASASARGGGVDLRSAIVSAAMSATPSLRALLPLSDEGARRLAMSRHTGLVLVFGVTVPVLLGLLARAEGVALAALAVSGVAAAIAYAVHFGRGTSLALVRRVAGDVLLERADARAA